jgi:hypothetical protein
MTVHDRRNAHTMTVAASGSTQGIAGFGGFSGLLDIEAGATLDHFTLELSSFSSSPGLNPLPNGFSFHLGHAPTVSEFTGFQMTIQSPQIGDSFTISPSGISPTPDSFHNWTDGPYGTLLRLVSGHEQNQLLGVPTVYGQMNIYPAGIDGSASGLFTLTAYGDPAPIPEPGTALLMGLGLAGLAGKGRRRNRS